MAKGNWHDPVRAYFGDDEQIYSWWSYRSRDWQVNNRGRRLDHVWVSTDLAGSVTKAEILTDYRNAEKPSDHVPTIITL
jgi:exodeoxyribonuclease-3